MVSLVEKFYINIPDLAGLMMLPEILIVIQERLFADPRLTTDYEIWTIVVLRNNQSKVSIDNGFDSFLLTHKFQQLQRLISRQQEFKINNYMDFSTQKSRIIVYNFLMAFENLSIDWSMLSNDTSIQSTDMNLDILDQIFKKTKMMHLDSNTYNIIPIGHKKVYTNVEQLRIVDNESYIGGINQMLELFPNLEKLEVQSICLMHDNFFAGFEQYFKSNFSKNLKSFKADLSTYSLLQKSTLTKLFQVIVEIDVPVVQLTFEISRCKANFLDPDVDPTYYEIFPIVEVERQYIDLKTDDILAHEDCSLTILFNKNLGNECQYTFDFTYKKRKNYVFN
eukprot:403362839